MAGAKLRPGKSLREAAVGVDGRRVYIGCMRDVHLWHKFVAQGMPSGPVPAVSRLVSTPVGGRDTGQVMSVGRRADAAGTSAQCRILFARAANSAEVVGRTPWSARDALVPLPEQRYRSEERRVGKECRSRW